MKDYQGVERAVVSEILPSESSGPIFRVLLKDDPAHNGYSFHYIKITLHRWTHSTASGVWMKVLQSLKRKPNISVSGPEMYGLSHPLVKRLIEELPNAKNCLEYEFMDCLESSSSFVTSNRCPHISNVW